MQNNSIEGRYQVGNATVGLYESHRTYTHAEAALRRLLQWCPEEAAWLYDRHAKRGAIQLETYTVTLYERQDGRKVYQYNRLNTERREK